MSNVEPTKDEQIAALQRESEKINNELYAYFVKNNYFTPNRAKELYDLCMNMRNDAFRARLLQEMDDKGLLIKVPVSGEEYAV